MKKKIASNSAKRFVREQLSENELWDGAVSLAHAADYNHIHEIVRRNAEAARWLDKTI